jgi:hypothetical protein
MRAEPNSRLADDFQSGAGEKIALWRRIIRLASRRYDSSVVRRSLLLLSLLVPAFCTNLAVLYLSANLLSAEQFGLFYVANALGNILFSGSLILNMFFTRYLVSAGHTTDRTISFGQMRKIERAVALSGGVLAGVVLVVMLLVSGRIGVQSYGIVLLVVLDAYTCYLAELGRVMLQYLRRTLFLGLYTLVWMSLRLVLCVGGILLFGTVWGALAGVVASTLLIYLSLHVWVRRNAPARTDGLAPLPSILGAVPAILGYVLSIVISNLDSLQSYLQLGHLDLGIYSASSVFPKTMLVLITPLLQMLFPMLITSGQDFRPPSLVIGKITGAILALVAGGVAVLWFGSGVVCGGSWGMPLCDPGLLDILLLSVLPLTMLRLLVLVEFANGHDRIVLWLVVPLLGYLLFVAPSLSSTRMLAESFAMFAAAVLSFGLAISVIASRRRQISAQMVDRIAER